MSGADPGNHLPERRHLRRLHRIFVRDPIFYISACVLHRQRAFTNEAIAHAAVAALRESAAIKGWTVGQHVVMPDHVHFLCAPQSVEWDLSSFVGAFKQSAMRKAWELGWEGRLWQHEFFDELITSRRLALQKWEYMRQNPVVLQLCASPDEWPYMGALGSF
jgi:putative transposase